MTERDREARLADAGQTWIFDHRDPANLSGRPSAGAPRAQAAFLPHNRLEAMSAPARKVASFAHIERPREGKMAVKLKPVDVVTIGVGWVGSILAEWAGPAAYWERSSPRQG